MDISPTILVEKPGVTQYNMSRDTLINDHQRWGADMEHLIIPRVFYLPPREVVKHGKDRWIIYLPKDYNEIWEVIKERGLKVRVYIEVVEPDQKQPMRWERVQDSSKLR